MPNLRKSSDSMTNTHKLDALLLKNTARQTTEVLLGNMFLMVINAAIFWNSIPQKFLIIWSLSLTSICVLRSLLAFIYLNRPQVQTLERWQALMLITSLAQGIAWGTYCAVAYQHLSLGEMVIVVMSGAGMTSGAVASTSSSRVAFFSFSVATLAPLAFLFLSSGTPKEQASGFLICLFFLLTFRQTKTINQLLIDSFSNSIELEKSKLRSDTLAKELYQLSTMDALTFIGNRRGFDEALTREWQRATRTNSPLSLILMDVDHFKAYNDNLGHQEGDQCLKEIATQLATHTRRAGDYVARYGGEEFAIILPDTTAEDALALADTVCKGIEALKLKHPQSSCGHFVTISAGVHTLSPTTDNDRQDLVRYADQALYQAKSDGRNCARCFSTP